ncbi:hypothetical protein [uncultured Treponema sp.]|uniref:hypothetical protein n=1 Tax=uncultured Treponema sp. TaxID=162155 RepID=UPI0025D3423D|nr:hypothetical protein [uncultured Treponema sp.]
MKTEKRNLGIQKLVVLAFLSLTLFSCVTMQDDVYVDNLSSVAEISDFEKRFSALDARYFALEDVVKEADYQRSCEKLISDINSALSSLSLKKAAVARLYALAGCVCYDMNDRTQAKKFYDLSVNAFKGETRTFVLARRLGLKSEISAKITADLPLMKLENALAHYSDMEYSQAVADFDEAFLSLEKFYRENYAVLRETSWNFRNLSSGDNAQLLSLKKLSVMHMLLIANLNPDLLFNYTAGKNLSNKDLYVKIAGSGLLNPVSKPLDAQNSVSKDTVVTKTIAARFLWNLYNHRKNTPSNLNKYSAAYQNKKRSPIVDVKLNSPDFDAVMGCVENEIMHLEDGIEFGTENEVSGVEFDESVKKIK